MVITFFMNEIRLPIESRKKMKGCKKSRRQTVVGTRFQVTDSCIFQAYLVYLVIINVYSHARN
jgi:hypothetical protein